MKAKNNLCESKKRIIIYLSLTMGICFLCGISAALLSDEIGDSIYNALQKGFTAIPVLAVLLTRYITKDKSNWNLSFRVWHNRSMLIFSVLLPGAAVLLGAAIYYMIFPQDLFKNVQSLFDFCTQYGLPSDIPVNAGTITVTVVILWLVSALAVPIHLLELGEEIGWRGYLLPLLLSFVNEKKAVLVSGILWGLMHSPLIYFGFNYGNEYWGAPYTGILLMLIVCISMGIWMSYVMIRTNNCMYSAIIHGAFNVAADIQILSAAKNRPLLGPTPTGIIGLSVILVISVILFFMMPKKNIA